MLPSNTPSANAEKLLRSWLDQVSSNERTHKIRALWFRKVYYILGVPASILSSFVTAGLFVDLVSCLATDDPLLKIWCVTKAIISAIVTVLVAVSTFLQLWSRYQDHKMASDRYQALIKKIQQILIVPIGDDEKYIAALLGNIQDIFDDIVASSPLISSNEEYLRFAVKDESGNISGGGFQKKKADIEMGTRRKVQSDEVVIDKKMADQIQTAYKSPNAELLKYVVEHGVDNGVIDG